MNDEINTQSNDENGGMCADNDTLADVPYAVAPSIEKRVNTIRLAFLPTVCWRIDDDRFDFDSSFILPTSTREFAMLADKRPPGPPAEPGTGPYVHVVQSGEWLDGIAKSYGFESWRDLYYSDENAGYRANHPDPNVLYPGDEIVIPGRTGGDTNEPQEDPDGLRLTVFGHADPTGRDDYNQVLAGRRAKAVYGLLVRDVEMWDELYRVSHGGDQWTLRHMQIMLVKCGYAAGEPDGVLGTNTMDATRAFQQDQGITASGYVDATTRKELFRAYMNAICVNGSGESFRYNRKDFLSRGETKDGKADYQSCSEFNPMVVFPQDEEAEYAKPENKGQRDEDNAVNRRVTIYMFPPNPRFPPDRWPCPTIKEGCGKCKAQFWIDGEKRRSPQGERRDSRKRGKTMACKWYDRIVWRGSCEGSVAPITPRFLRILSPDFEPIANTSCNIRTRGCRCRTTTDSEGIAEFRASTTARNCTVSWTRAGTSIQRQDVRLEPSGADSTEVRLNNLGYEQSEPEEKVKAFQRDFGRVETGLEADVAHEVERWHDWGEKPDREGAAGATDKTNAKAQEDSGRADCRRKLDATVAQKPHRVHVIIEWPNPEHDFLSSDSGATQPVIGIAVTVGGGRRLSDVDGLTQWSPRDASKRIETRDGVRHRRITIDATGEQTLRVEASFTPSFSAAGKAPAQHTVFKVSQDLELKPHGGGPRFEPLAPASGARHMNDHHPLLDISLPTAPSASNVSTTTITLRTEFVDVTEIWNSFAGNVAEFHSIYATAVSQGWLGGRASDSVRVLGYTGRSSNGPLLWMSYASDSARALSSGSLHCVLLCRHTLNYHGVKSYTHITDSAHDMIQAFGKYLLPAQSFPLKNGEQQDAISRIPNGKGSLMSRFSLYLPAGFGQSISATGKPVTLLCPLPHSAPNGQLGGNSPKTIIDEAIRFLWGTGSVALQVHRSGPRTVYLLAGFSAGGADLWHVFDRMKDDVRAVFAFDPNGTGAKLQNVVAWLAANASRFFGLTVGENLVYGAWALDSFVKSPSFTAQHQQILLSPNESERETFWIGSSRNPWWYHTVTHNNSVKGTNLCDLVGITVPAGQSRLSEHEHRLARHGFALHGGPANQPHGYLYHFLSRALGTP